MSDRVNDRVNDILIMLRGMADQLRQVSAETEFLCEAVLERAALVADQVEAKAEPGHGKEAAAEIGRRIRALMEDGRWFTSRPRPTRPSS